MEYNPDSAPLKVVFGGNAAAGKTSILHCLVSGKPIDSKERKPTTAAALSQIVLEKAGKTYSLNAWDTAGQERYRSLASMYFRSVDIAMLIYDVTDASSFECIPDWISDIEESVGEKPHTFIIVGNKIDLEGRVISYQDGNDLAREYNANFVEFSAVTNEGYNMLTDIIAEQSEYLMRENKERMLKEERAKLKLEESQNSKGKSCC